MDECPPSTVAWHAAEPAATAAISVVPAYRESSDFRCASLAGIHTAALTRREGRACGSSGRLLHHQILLMSMHSPLECSCMSLKCTVNKKDPQAGAGPSDPSRLKGAKYSVGGPLLPRYCWYFISSFPW